MSTVYDDYSRDRIGWFFGLSGTQGAVLAGSTLPTWVAISQQRWAAAGMLILGWVLLVVLVAVPVRGRSATGWAVATLTHALGAVTGWSRYRARATTGPVDLAEADLPGPLRGLRVHDGPPVGVDQRRPALIANHPVRTWAVTARIVHPGTGITSVHDRHLGGLALTGLLDLAQRTELVDEVLVQVRTVPDDGAERRLWVEQNSTGDAPELAVRVNTELAAHLQTASVRTETFVTLVVPESAIARPAREAGGGVVGRGRVLAGVMSEVEAHLRGPLRVGSVTWLTSPELAAACRTGFAPEDRAGLVDDAARASGDRPGVGPGGGRGPGVPWAMAGPSGADTTVRHYGHDAWHSVSTTIGLPDEGAVIGALAPVLTPAAGERRCLLVSFPVVAATKADRQSANAEYASDVAGHLRRRLGVKVRARQRNDSARAAAVDSKLAAGKCLVKPYAVCTVTVPRTMPASDAGRRLDASVRRAGFAPLRLDLAHDVAFAATVVPLGVSLVRTGQW